MQMPYICFIIKNKETMTTKVIYTIIGIYSTSSLTNAKNYARKVGAKTFVASLNGEELGYQIDTWKTAKNIKNDFLQK